jgi:hypothetical protein
LNDRSDILGLMEVCEGLREGLSHFSRPSRTAVIFAKWPQDPVRVYDPLNLLRGHEPRLEELFVDSTLWRESAPDIRNVHFFETLKDPEGNYQLTGLIALGGWSPSLFFQMWFTEHHPDLCSTGPTERWLEYAAGLLARNLAVDHSLNIGTSGYVLQEYATHAVRDHIVDQRNLHLGMDTGLRIFPTLDAILTVSKTLEEGRWPRGCLAFVEPGMLPKINFLARFPRKEQPSLENYKHVRKLLQSVEDSDRTLVAENVSIVGIAEGEMPPHSLIADFRGGHGFVWLNEELVCSFSDGRFHSSTRKAVLVQVEEVLLESSIETAHHYDLFRIISRIVDFAGEHKHGCTLVIDPNLQPLKIPGQKLASPLDLTKAPYLDLAKSLAKVDGALHIGGDLKLHKFACLLDGHARKTEDRSRGARFNSALRFTAEHPELMVVVVSSDRPVSVLQGGVELTAQCHWRPCADWLEQPPLLADWIKSD